MKAQILIRSPDTLKKLLQKEAEKNGFTLNAMCLKILWSYFQQEGREGGKQKSARP